MSRAISHELGHLLNVAKPKHWLVRLARLLTPAYEDRDFIREGVANLIGLFLYKRIRNQLRPTVEVAPVPFEHLYREFRKHHPDWTGHYSRLLRQAYEYARITYADALYPSGETFIAHASRVAYTLAHEQQGVEAIVVALLYQWPPGVERWDPVAAGAISLATPIERGHISKLIAGIRQMLPEPYNPEIPETEPVHTVQDSSIRLLRRAALAMGDGRKPGPNDAVAELLCLTLADRLQTIRNSPEPVEGDESLLWLYREIIARDAPVADWLGLTDLASNLRTEVWKRLYKLEYERIHALVEKARGLTFEQAQNQLDALKERALKLLSKDEDLKGAILRERIKEEYRVWEKEQAGTPVEDQHDLLGLMIIDKDEAALIKLWGMDLEESLGPSKDYRSELDYKSDGTPVRRSRWHQGRLGYRTVGLQFENPDQPGNTVRVELQMMTEDYYKNVYLHGTTQAMYQLGHWIYAARRALKVLFGSKKTRMLTSLQGQQFDHQVQYPADFPIEQMFGSKGLPARVGIILDSLFRNKDPHDNRIVAMYPTDPDAFDVNAPDKSRYRYMNLPEGATPVDLMVHPEVDVDPANWEVCRIRYAMDPRGKLVKDGPTEVLGDRETIPDDGILFIRRRPADKTNPLWTHPVNMETVLGGMKTYRAALRQGPYSEAWRNDMIQRGIRYLQDHFGDPNNWSFQSDVRDPALRYLGFAEPDEFYAALGASESPLKDDPLVKPFAHASCDFKAWYDRRFFNPVVSPPRFDNDHIVITTTMDENQVGMAAEQATRITELGWTILGVQGGQAADGKGRVEFTLARAPQQTPTKLEQLRAALGTLRRQRGIRAPEEEGRRLDVHIAFKAEMAGRAVSFTDLLTRLSDLNIDVETIRREVVDVLDYHQEYMRLTVVAPGELGKEENLTPKEALRKELRGLPGVEMAERRITEPSGAVRLVKEPMMDVTNASISRATLREANRIIFEECQSLTRWGFPIPEIVKTWDLPRLSPTEEGLVDYRFLSRFRRTVRFMMRYHGDLNPDREANYNWAEFERRRSGEPYAVHCLVQAYENMNEMSILDPVEIMASVLHDVREDGPINVWIWVDKTLQQIAARPLSDPERDVKKAGLVRRFPQIPETIWAYFANAPDSSALKKMIESYNLKDKIEELALEEIKDRLRKEFLLYADELDLAIGRLEVANFNDLVDHGTITEDAAKMVDREQNLRDMYEPYFTKKDPLFERPKQKVSETVRDYLRLVVKEYREHPVLTEEDARAYKNSRLKLLQVLIDVATDPRCPPLIVYRQPGENPQEVAQELLLTLRKSLVWANPAIRPASNPVIERLRREILEQLDQDKLAQFIGKLEQLRDRIQSGAQNEPEPPPEIRSRGIRTFHLPLYIWRLFAQYLKTAHKRGKIAENVYQAIVERGEGPARVTKEGEIKVEKTVLRILTKAINDANREKFGKRYRKVTQRQVEAFLKLHEARHLELREAPAIVETLLWRLHADSLYAPEPGQPAPSVRSYEELKQFFINNYGKEYAQDDLFAGELRDLYWTPAPFLGGMVKLINEKGEEVDLPANVIQVIHEVAREWFKATVARALEREDVEALFQYWAKIFVQAAELENLAIALPEILERTLLLRLTINEAAKTLTSGDMTLQSFDVHSSLANLLEPLVKTAFASIQNLSRTDRLGESLHWEALRTVSLNLLLSINSIQRVLGSEINSNGEASGRTALEKDHNGFVGLFALLFTAGLTSGLASLPSMLVALHSCTLPMITTTMGLPSLVIAINFALGHTLGLAWPALTAASLIKALSVGFGHDIGRVRGHTSIWSTPLRSA
jgi:hypothetical protein